MVLRLMAVLAFRGSNAFAWLGLLACFMGVLPSAMAETPGCPTPSMYQRGDTLQETLLATRQCYGEWLAEQPAARKAVELGPWFVTPARPFKVIDALVHTETDPEAIARALKGQPLWRAEQGWADGKIIKLPGNTPGEAMYMRRSLTAKQPVTLTVGLGGGNRLDVWLNGEKLASADTTLTSGRYGCTYRTDGTRVDQLIVDLDLREGENTLLVRVATAEEASFTFSIAPRPVPRLWQRARCQFPAAEHPLLTMVHADWFAPEGWFSADDAHFERQFIERLAANCGDAEPTIDEELKRLVENKVDYRNPRWLDLCVKASSAATLYGDLTRLREAVTALGKSHPGEYPAGEFLAELDRYEARLKKQAALGLDPAEPATAALLGEMPRLRRRMLVDSNPMLRDAELLLVKRYTYNSKHYYDDFQHISRWGGNLCVLSMADGSVRRLVPELDGGVFDRYDLSFDGRRIAFGYRRPRPEGYRIWEVGVDGSGLRQVTVPPDDEPQRIEKYGTSSRGDSFYGAQSYQFWTDDVHPCYLPDGGLCFASTRCEHGVLCTPLHYLACTNLFRLDADGGNLRPLSYGALSEFTPTMMQDGRILYNRWEYVYKGIAAVQPLWTMRPDGSGSEEFYGDNITNPGVFWQARQLPGHPRKAVCIGCGHEPMGVGQVLLVDLDKGKRTPEAMTSLTPNVRTEGLRGLYQRRNGVWREDLYGPFYADPYPLSDKFFLVACNPEGRYNDQAAYGIYLLDVFGNRVPIYQDPEISCWQPMPLAPRKRPPVVASLGQHVAESNDQPAEPEPSADSAVAAESQPQEQSAAGDPEAAVFLSDVYRGLEGVERGAVKYVRVMEQIPKPWAAEIDPARDEDRGADGFGGHIAVSHHAHIWIAVLRGIVPVEEDGSACFKVPAGRNLFFQALDEDFMEIQRMRTFVSFEPGESRSCIGCHEHRVQAPAVRKAMAFGRPPVDLIAQPGEVAPRPLYYPTDVQPILDKHCVDCHDGKHADTSLDLRGEMTQLFNRSYESIFKAELVSTIREWAGMSYSMMHAPRVPPYTYGSHQSRLVDVLQKGHHDVKLSRAEWVKLVTWIDCGAPYYGSYYGRRNLRYRGQPDFRPVPTVASACGIAPPPVKPIRPPAVPAKLIARWRFDEGDGAIAADATGGGHEGRVVKATWEKGVSGGALEFRGEGYVEAGGLGELETLSVAMWVRAESLQNRWNPLLFTERWAPSAMHLSLLESGQVNVALNDGQSVHSRSEAGVADGAWHHVAVVVDTRPGGQIAFYLDGAIDKSAAHASGAPIKLQRFRLGSWAGWDGQREKNFHGRLDGVQIFRGLLTEKQVADLAADRR